MDAMGSARRLGYARRRIYVCRAVYIPVEVSGDQSVERARYIHSKSLRLRAYMGKVALPIFLVSAIYDSIAVASMLWCG